MGHQDGPATMVQDMPQRGERRLDARVVGDAARFVERHVVVHAYEHAPAAQFEVGEGADVHRQDPSKVLLGGREREIVE